MAWFRILSATILYTLYLSPTFAHTSNVFARQVDNCLPNFSKCPQAGLPSNFCCPTGDTCISLAANTTALCCSPGQSCGSILALSCDLDLQDSVKRPNATLKTTALSIPLPRCGNSCCPHGFSCKLKSGPQGQDLCIQNQDQSISPFPNRSSSSISLPASTISPSTSTSINSPTLTSSATPSSTALPQNEEPCKVCPDFTVKGALIFFFAGLAAGIIITSLACAVAGGRRKKKQEARLSRASTASFGNHRQIGTPHLQVGYDGRVDFLHKPPGTASTARTLVDSAFVAANLGRTATVKRAKSIFSLQSTHKDAEKDDNYLNHLSQIPKPSPLRPKKQAKVQAPVTPPQQVRKQSEFGDITIGTDTRTATSSNLDRPWQQQSGFTSSPQAYKQRGEEDNNTSGLGINRGSGLGVGGSSIPAILLSGNGQKNQKKYEQSSNQASKDDRRPGKGLQPPLPFTHHKNASKESHLTTFTMIQDEAADGSGAWGSKRKGHERTASGGIASLPPKGMPFVYKSPQGR